MGKEYRLLFLLLLLPVLAGAQLCEGEMGESALHEHFGSGHNYGPALPEGATTYEYVTSFPVAGTYMVSNRSQLNGAKWHPGLDNTPNDGNGYMLLASFSISYSIVSARAPAMNSALMLPIWLRLPPAWGKAYCQISDSN